MAQTLLFFAPILICAGLLPLIYRDAGFGRSTILLACVPLVVVLGSLVAALVDPRPAGGAPLGLWLVAGGILVYVLLRRSVRRDGKTD